MFNYCVFPISHGRNTFSKFIIWHYKLGAMLGPNLAFKDGTTLLHETTYYIYYYHCRHSDKAVSHLAHTVL